MLSSFYLIFLLPLFFIKPFWGLCIYLIVEGYIGLQAIQFIPQFDIDTQLANFNQLIIISMLLRGIIPHRGKNYLPKYSKQLFVFITIFTLMGFLSWLWADHSKMAIIVSELERLLKMLFFGLATFLTIRSYDQLKKVLIISLGIFFIQDVIQIVEFVMNGNAVIQGGGLTLLTVSIIVLQKDIKFHQKVFFQFCLFLVVSSFLIAGTRRGFSAMAIVTLATIYIHSSKRLFIRSFIIITIIGLTFNWLSDVELKRRIVQTKKILNFEHDSWSGREKLWLAGWEMVKEKPILGHGFGSSTYLMSDYVYKVGRGYIEKTRMHNTYLKAWAEMGIIGLLVFIGVMYFMIRSFYLSAIAFKKQGDEIMYVLLFASFASMIGYLGIAVFGWSGYLDKPFWFQAAMALVASKILLTNQLSHKMTPT